MAIQDLVNQIESALPSIITKGLDTLIVNEGMDPWNDVYSCEESSHSSWMGCNFDYTAAVSVQKIEHLSSLYIKNLTQNGDIVDDGNGNYTVALDTKIKLSYDIYYIIHFSILLDFLILFKTIRLVFNAKGSSPNIWM